MIRWAIVTAVLCTFTVVRGPAWASGFLSSPCRISRSNGVRSSSTNGMSGRAVSRPTMLKSSADVHINKDIVVIGGGLAGLSTALELAKRGRQVMVLSRSRSEAAAEAAGGMIAPQAERLESGPYLDLCLASRAMYADWVSSIESIAGLGGDKAETHFWSCGGFLAPAFGGDAVHVWKPPLEGGQAHWINREQVQHSGCVHLDAEVLRSMKLYMYHRVQCMILTDCCNTRALHVLLQCTRTRTTMMVRYEHV